MEDDLALLSRYNRDGDSGAFQAVVRSHAGMVFAAACRITQDAALAEEVAQDTFLALAKRGESIRHSVAAWLHHVARQKACNALRGELRRQRHEQSAAEILHEDQDGSWADIEPLLDHALDGLPQEPRCLLIEHFLQQLTQQEIAQRRGLSQSTVSRQIEAALQTLRAALKRKGLTCGLGLAGLLSANTSHAATPASLAASLGKLTLTGLGSGTGTAAFLTMTTTTKALLGIAAAATLSVAFLLPQKPSPAPKPTSASVTPSSAPPAPRSKSQVKATPRPQPRSAPTLDQLWDEQQTVLEDRQLILAEFKRLGATVRDEFVDADIAAILRDQFRNDRAAFERDLAEKGFTPEQFKNHRREMMMIAALKARAAKDSVGPEAKQRAIDNWLMDLRLKAGLSGSTPSAKADDDG